MGITEATHEKAQRALNKLKEIKNLLRRSEPERQQDLSREEIEDNLMNKLKEVKNNIGPGGT